jgi:hypothetical protein
MTTGSSIIFLAIATIALKMNATASGPAGERSGDIG